jgi:hypothetical protein
MNDPFRALVEKAVEVLQRHAPPDGLSDHDALTELYGIFDGPEYRSACEARSAIACIYGEPCAHPEKCKLYGECYRKLSANPSHEQDIHAGPMYDLARECGWSEVSSRPPVCFIRDKIAPPSSTRALKVGDVECSFSYHDGKTIPTLTLYFEAGAFSARDALAEQFKSGAFAPSAIEPVKNFYCSGHTRCSEQCELCKAVVAASCKNATESGAKNG